MCRMFVLCRQTNYLAHSTDLNANLPFISKFIFINCYGKKETESNHNPSNDYLSLELNSNKVRINLMI
jgi:hypothetical protein